MNTSTRAALSYTAPKEASESILGLHYAVIFIYPDYRERRHVRTSRALPRALHSVAVQRSMTWHRPIYLYTQMDILQMTRGERLVMRTRVRAEHVWRVRDRSRVSSSDRASILNEFGVCNVLFCGINYRRKAMLKVERLKGVQSWRWKGLL